MTIFMSDQMLDAQIDLLIAKGQKVHLLTSYNDNYAVITGVNGSMGNFTPAITKGDLAPDGRKAIIDAASGIIITTVDPNVDEYFTHYAVVDDTNTSVLYVGESAKYAADVLAGNPTKGKLLSNGDSVSTPIFNVRVPDAVTAP